MELSKQSLSNKKYGTMVFAVLGAVGGYAYYYWIGCVSGTCPITSNPWISTGYGALLGFLIFPALHDLLKKKKEKE